MKDGTAPGGGILVGLPGHQLRAQGLGGWPIEGPPHARQGLNRIEGPGHSQLGSKAEHQEQERTQKKHGHGKEREGAPVPAIRGITTKQCQREKRHGFREPDEAQGQWIMGDLVHLPTHDQALHLEAHEHGHDARQEPAVFAVAQGLVGIVRKGRLGAHALTMPER